MLEHYNPILGAIQDLCPTAHIAGGAVRDTILDRPIKDIDLFLDDAHIEEAAQKLRDRFGYVKVGEWTRYEQFSDPAVARLAKFERADETIPLCLIGLVTSKPMHKNVDRFDFGVCMAAWDGIKIYKNNRFDADVAAKTFTLHRADDQPQFDYSMSRFKKLTGERYAGWTLAVLPQFEGLAREHTFNREWYRDYGKFFGVGPNRLKPKDRPYQAIGVATA